MKLCIITTGGTIDKDYPRSSGGYAFEIDEPAIGRILEQQKQLNIQYEIISVCKKDSTEVTDTDRENICNVIRKAKSSTKRFLITHGTDTLIETANYIRNSGCCDPVDSDDDGILLVCTGSMKPERFKDSDADFNVGGAIVALSVLPLNESTQFSSKSSSVYVCIGGRLIDCRKCIRDKNGFFLEG